jgi:hypothetical protein
MEHTWYLSGISPTLRHVSVHSAPLSPSWPDESTLPSITTALGANHPVSNFLSSIVAGLFFGSRGGETAIDSTAWHCGLYFITQGLGCSFRLSV